MPAIVPLPGRTLRVGVTGTRKLSEPQRTFVACRVTSLLQDVVALTANVKAGRPRLQVFSPLAEGADRCVAECALAEGFALTSPLPFPQPEYEKDFTAPGSVDAFRDLLARAEGRVLALDGARGDDESRSYEAVGRLVVRNTDLLIAIWDGHPGTGRGGTADTIRYAANAGPPVVWIHATDPAIPPCWIEDAHDLRYGAPRHPVADHLPLYLKRLLEAPDSGHHGDHGALHWLGHRLAQCRDSIRHWFGYEPPATPLVAFLQERPNPAGVPWRLHGWLMRFMAGGQDAPWTPPHSPDGPVAKLWFARYQPADDRAGECAKRYRSSYVWAFLLAFLALSAAATALASGEAHIVKTIATGVELATLGLIFGLVVADGLFAWQRRAIEYRLVAELCRKQQTLAPLAWVVPRSTAWANTLPDSEDEEDAPHVDPISWVTWLFSAWLRDTPPPTGTIDSTWVEAARWAALQDLLNDQIDYHETRRRQSYRAGRRLIRIGELLFLIVLVLVLLKFCLLLFVDQDIHGWLVALGLAGAILPALSAAFVGIRAYAELEMLSEQSDAMLKAMRRAKTQIEELDVTAPLASQALGSALAVVATLMLEDLEGWARLFRGKVVDA